MHNKYASFIRFLNFIYDLALLNVILLFLFIRFSPAIPATDLLFNKIYFFNWLNINLAWVAATIFTNVYTLRNLIYFKEGVKNSFNGLILFILFVVCINFFLSSVVFFSKKDLLIFITLFSFFFWLARLIFYYIKKRNNLELYAGKRVLLIGDTSTIEEVKNTLYEKKELGFVYAGHVIDTDYNNNSQQFIDNLLLKIEQQHIDEVFFAKSSIKDEELYNLIQLLDKNTIRVRVIPDFFRFYTKFKNLHFYGNLPLLSLRDEPLQNMLNRTLKRSFDIVFSLLVIVLIASWLFPLLALLIKLESKGPIFFKQLRSGKDNKQFWCYKFRSMKLNTNANEIQATKGDQRITKIGAFIRKTSIDELPQFFNVFIGNMSVVGPRPHMIKHTEQYAQMVEKYMIRHFVKPGITGWAQVNGYRGEISNSEAIQKRVEFDIWYIENWSFVLDIQVVLLTVYNIFRGEEKAY